MSGLIADAGALIGVDRNQRAVVSLIERARQRGQRIAIPAGCLAQAWRDGSTQARLAALARHSATDVHDLDASTARRIGELLGVTGTSDVVDGHVAVLAVLTGSAVLTGDAADIARLAPSAVVKQI